MVKPMTEFKKFKLGDIFAFKAIKQAKSQRAIPTETEGIPYVVQSQANNMVSRCVNKNWLIEHNEPPVKGNCLVLGVTLPAVSYQPYDFGASQVITARNDALNEKIGLYFVTLLKKQMQLFSYTRKPGLERYKRLEISLPVNSGSNQINWKYMEDRVEALEQDRVEALANYLTVTKLNDYQLTEEDKRILKYTPIFADFKIGQVFNVKKGKRLTKANQIPGSTLFIGSTSLNHGKTARVGQQAIFEANTITVCYNGSVGETFYQEEPYWASDDINVLTLKDHNLNAEIAEYFCALLRKAGEKYGYTYKWNVHRMKETTIKIPVVKKTHDIDLDYMEKYIKVIQKLTIKDVVKYKDRVIAKTKDVIKNSRP